MLRVPVKEVEMSTQNHAFYQMLFRVIQLLERIERKLDQIDKNTSVHVSPG